VGLSLAIVDDVALGDNTSLRDRKRAEVYERWLTLAPRRRLRVRSELRAHLLRRVGCRSVPEKGPLNQMGSAAEPRSLGGAVRYAYRVAPLPVLVTEHCTATADDTLRANFIEPSLLGLLDAIDDGVPVLGYLRWTLLDNVEWIFGYTVRYGLHEGWIATPSSAQRSRAPRSTRPWPGPMPSGLIVSGLEGRPVTSDAENIRP
jgi:beta-glucosidase